MVHGVRTRVVAWTIVLRQLVTEDYLFELREQFNGDGSDDSTATAATMTALMASADIWG